MSAGLGAFIDFAKESWFKIADNEMMEEDRNQRQAYDESQRHIERGWQENMAGSRYQRTVSDLERAGLNPMLAIQGASGAGVSGSTGSSAGGPGRVGSSPIPFASAAQAAVLMAQEDNVRAQTELTRAQTGEVQARTPTYEVSMEKMRQEIQESVQRIQTLIATASREESSAANLQQQTQNLREQIPQIRQTVKLLAAQTVESLTRSGVNEAHAKEIMQKIKEDLPELQKALLELEVKERQLEQPGRMQDAVIADSWIGTASRVMKALLPIGGVFGTIPLGGRSPGPGSSEGGVKFRPSQGRPYK